MPPFNRAAMLEKMEKKRQSDSKADAGNKKRAKNEALPSPPAPPTKGGITASAKVTATPSREDKKPVARDVAPSSSSPHAVTANDMQELKDLISTIITHPTTDPVAAIKTLLSDFNAQRAEELEGLVNATKDDVASQRAADGDALVTRMVAEFGGVVKRLENVEERVVGLASMHEDLAQEMATSHTAVLDALKPVGSLEQRLASITEKQKTTLSSVEDFYGQMKATFMERDNCLRINKDLHKQFEDATNIWEVQVAKNLDSGIIDDQLQKICRNGTHTAPHK